jgi:hypothetical protein
LRNLGTKVSRVLPAEDRSYTGVVFQPLRPPLDSEWNLVQALGTENLNKLVSAITTSGFVVKGPIRGRPANGTNAWKHTIAIPNPVVLINGRVMQIGGGTNQFQTNATQNIWQMLSGGDESVNFFILGDGPSTGSREDLVFLEFWEELLSAESYVPKYGNTQFAGTPVSNDMVDPNIGRETTKRTQFRYRFRVVEGVDLISFRNGVDHPSVFAQGSKTSPVTGKTFIKTPEGHFRAGGGTNTDISALGTVDGYVYALPICAVHRRNRTAYSSTNLNGGAKKIEELVSDRPDGLFVDEIANHEIEDLRNVVEFNLNLPSLAEKSLRDLMDGLPNRLALGTTPELFSAKNIQVDGIAKTERATVADNKLRRPNGVRRSFTDNETVQRTISYITTGTLTDGRFELDPPEFYTSADMSEYQDFNPFIGIQTLPKIINATTGNPIAPGNEGISGWTNLGDRLHKGKVYFKPSVNSDIIGKPLLVEYDLVLPAGSGLSLLPENFYSVRDDLNGKEVTWTRDGKIRSLSSSRTVGGYSDSSLVRPVSSFISPGTQREELKGGTVERVWHTVGNGTAKITLPSAVDGLEVLGVLRVQVAQTGLDVPLGFGVNPKVMRKSDGTFEVNFQSFFPSASDVLKLTLLLGGVVCEVDTAHKGITNFSKTTFVTITSNGSLSYTIRQSTVSGNKMDFIYAFSGYQDPTGAMKAYCYISDTTTGDGSWTEIVQVDGLGTSTITVTFLVAPSSGKTIKIPVFGSYAPLETDLYSTVYSAIPYQGLSNNLSEGETIEADLIYLSEQMIVTSNGTGGGPKNDHEDAKIVHLPINYIENDHDFENRDVNSVAVRTNGSTNKFHYTYSYKQGTKPLEEGDVITLKKIGEGSDNFVKRGLALISPEICIQGGRFEDLVEEDLSPQTSSGNKIFKTRTPILNVYGTYCLSRVFTLAGVAVFSNGSRTVNGVGALFTRQLKPGMKIRPLGDTEWNTVHSVVSDTVVELRTAYTGAYTGPFELYMPDMKVFIDGVEAQPNDFYEVRGKDNTIVMSSAVSPASEVKIVYRTGQTTMAILHGIAQGRGQYAGELFLFCVTSTASADWVSSPEFNLLKEGRANSLIINNNAPVVSTTGQRNEANRILGSADLYYPSDRIIKVRTKVD